MTASVYYVPAVPATVVSVDRLRLYAPGDTARTGATSADVGPAVAQADGSWLFTVPVLADGVYPARVGVTYVGPFTEDDLTESVAFPIPERRGDVEGLAPWVSIAAVMADNASLADAQAEEAAQAASEILYALSGRRFDGPRVSVLEAPFLPGPGSVPLPFGATGVGMAVRSRGVPSPLNEVDAGVFPVTRCAALMIGTHEVDATLVRVVNRRRLRLSYSEELGSLLGYNLWSDGDGNVYSLWPGGDCGCGCGPARATVTVEWGEDPPAGGRLAARALAKEIGLALLGQSCRLPGNAINVARQGVTVLLDPSTYLDKGRTGLPAADLWLRTVNPHGLVQESTVWTPDMPYADRVV